MKKTVVWWFSGAGDAWLIASRVAAGLSGAGQEVELRAIEAERKPRLRMAATRAWSADGDEGGPGIDAEGLDVVCFPVYAFTEPAMVDAFLARLPVAIGRRAAVIAAMGGKGYEGRALARAARRLRENGRKVVLTAALEMPEAFVQFSPATPPEEAEARIAAACAAVDGLVADLLAGRETLRKPRLGGRILTWPAAAGFPLVARRLLGLSWAASKECNACGLCARHCPARTIAMASGRPLWGWKCEDCQRCANLCPKGAIRLSLPRLVLVVLPGLLPWGGWLERAFGIAGKGWAFPLGLLGLVVATAAMALLLRALSRLPGLRDFLALSPGMAARRRLAPGFREALAAAPPPTRQAGVLPGRRSAPGWRPR